MHKKTSCRCKWEICHWQPKHLSWSISFLHCCSLSFISRRLHLLQVLVISFRMGNFSVNLHPIWSVFGGRPAAAGLLFYHKSWTHRFKVDFPRITWLSDDGNKCAKLNSWRFSAWGQNLFEVDRLPASSQLFGRCETPQFLRLADQ